MLTFFIFILSMLTFLIFEKFSFAFAINYKNTKIYKQAVKLKDLKASRMFNVVPIVAAAAGGGGAAAGGGAAGGMGGMGGMGSIMGMMGGGGKGGGGGKSGGGGMMDKMGNSTNMINAGMGLATGIVQSIQAAKLKKRADAAFPELVDPNQSGYLAELNQKRKSIDTGADFAAGMQSIDTTNAGVNDALVRNAGGDAGGAIQALLQSQRTANEGKNQVLAQGQQQQLAYTGMYGSLMDKIAGRKMQLQLLRSQQARAEWDHKSKVASANLQAGLAGLQSGLKPGNDSKNQPQQPLPQLNSSGSGAPAHITTGPAESSIFGSKAPPANPNPTPATSVETTGVPPPSVVPQQSQANKVLGPIMNLIKK